MNSPLKSAVKTIVCPVLKPALFIRDFFRKRPLGYKFSRKLSNFVFEYSKETALIMLFGDAVSILSSHNAQIKSLEKSDRENKDLLISQEKIERILDLGLSIVPPIFLTRKIKKCVESGHLTTRKFQNLQREVILPSLGIEANSLNHIEHIRPIKETAIVSTHKALKSLSEYKAISPQIDYNTLSKAQKLQFNTQNVLKKGSNYLKSKVKYLDTTEIPKSLQELCIAVDNLTGDVPDSVRCKLRNGSAFDEFQGMVNGFTIAGVIAYSILSTNIIMPIVRNKLSSKFRTEQLANMGLTRSDIKRRKRFAYTNTQMPETGSEIFSSFNSPSFANRITKQENDKIPKPNESNTFSSFNTFSKIASQSTGLRI